MPVPTKNQVARWAAALTLGQPNPIADTFNTTRFFAQAPLRIHYAAVFNGATATQVHNVSPFNWICCLLQPLRRQKAHKVINSTRRQLGLT